MMTMGTTITAAVMKYKGGRWATSRRVSRVAVVARKNHEHTCIGIDDDRLRRIGSAMMGVAGGEVPAS
jgi:hypothetical protein